MSSWAVARPRSSRNARVRSPPAGRVTTSHRPPSCWNAKRPIAFSPSVRSSPALVDSKSPWATSRSCSAVRPRPSSETAITGRLPFLRRTTRMRAPRIPASAYSSAALETNSFMASFGSW
ncbi:MAG TPA: hypothetical protein VE777_18875 [Gaiellales bacterium]|nr:hypothetical protein [Gaiellales bacterium]